MPISVLINVDKDGNVDSKKSVAIEFLFSILEATTDPLLLTGLAETFAVFDVATLRKVYSISMKVSDLNEDESDCPDDFNLSESILFCPERLFEHFAPISTQSAFKKLVAHLVSYEVDQMPRPLFVGAVESYSTQSKHLNDSPALHPAFCNDFLTIGTPDASLCRMDDIAKWLKSKVVLKMPSVPTLLWYVRPYLRHYLMAYMHGTLSKIDDQSLLRSLASIPSIIDMLKGTLIYEV